LISEGILGSNAYVVVAGPANTYGHYIATLEEYGVQRYEGASTIYGQCMCCISHHARFGDLMFFFLEDTLDAYIDKYTSLVTYLGPNATGTAASDPAAPEQTSKAISLQVPFPVLINFSSIHSSSSAFCFSSLLYLMRLRLAQASEMS
jgi:neutral ceramidase